MDNSRRQSALPGLELSPIGAPMPNSAFSPAWNRYAASSSSPFVAHNIVPDIQRFIAADDTDNDKLRMQDTIQAQASKITDLQENLQELEYLRRELELKEDNISRLELEVKGLKKKNSELTSRCTILSEEKNDMQSKIDSANREAEYEATKLKADIEKLQSHLTLAFQAESASKTKFQQFEKEHNSYVQRAENKIKAYEKEIYNFKMQMTDLKHTKSHPHLSPSPSPSPSESPLVSQLQKEVDYYKAMAASALEAQKELDRMKIELDHSENKYQQLQLSPAFKNHQEREQIIASQRSDIKAYQEQDRKYHIAQARVRDLQDQAENSALLNEQIRQYKARAERHEELVQRANKLQLELDALQAEKSKWESFQGGASGFQSPQHMAQSLASLQQEVSLLVSQKGELSTKVHTLEVAQKHDKQTLEELRGELETLRKLNKEHESAISIRDQQILFLSKEKDASKRLLDSYANTNTAHGQEDQLAQRIKDLEKTVADRDALIRSLEEKITPSQQPTTITKLTQEVMDLKAENAQLLKEVEDNAKLISSMETRLGHGEFDTSTSKILHFTNNPERMKLTAELEAAKTELTTLRTQLEKQIKIEKQLQLQLQQQQINPSQQPLPSEVAELQQKVFDAEKMNTRLKSVFRSKIDAIKDMIAQLLGYRIEISRDQYTLISTYAEKDTDHFVFRPEGNKMVLMETEFTKQWANDIDVYLYKCKSIPAFLSTVTLEYFNRQTYAG